LRALNGAQVDPAQPGGCRVASGVSPAVCLAGPHDRDPDQPDGSDPTPGDEDARPEDAVAKYRELLKRLGDELKKWRR
jgi:hypothetical protein